MTSMTELMDEHVVSDLHREIHQGNVEADDSLATTTTPAAFCVAVAYALVVKAIGIG